MRAIVLGWKAHVICMLNCSNQQAFRWPACNQSNMRQYTCPGAEVPLLKDRDFVYREVTQQLPGGVHIIFGQSITLEEEGQCSDVPHPPSVIRGEMGASGERRRTGS